MINFHYNARGYGDLVIGTMHYPCRTGSIDHSGNLINPCPQGLYSLDHKSQFTNEIGMMCGEFGLKIALYLNGNRTHYLIHFDGNKPGSLGCIVLLPSKTIAESQKNLIELMGLLDDLVKKGSVPVEVKYE